MKNDELDARARLRAHARALISDLRHLGVPDSTIRQCRTLCDLDDLKAETVARCMRAPEVG